MSEKTIDQLVTILSAIANFDSERLIRRPEDWGPLNFDEWRGPIESSIRAAKTLYNSELENLPKRLQTELKNHAEHILNTFKRIDSFSINEENQPPRETTAQIGQELDERIQKFITCAGTSIFATNYLKKESEKEIDIDKITEEVKIRLEEPLSKLTSFINQIEEIQSNAKSRLNEIEEAVTAARAAAENESIGKFSTHFDEAVAELKNSKIIWIGSTIFFLLLSSYLIYYFFSSIKIEEIAQMALPSLVVYGGIRFFALGAALTATLWCGKNYRTIEHQIIINKHRSTALKTFRGFVEAAGDSFEIKNAVLLETTRSIFAHVPTGFVDGKPSEGPMTILETIKSPALNVPRE